MASTEPARGRKKEGMNERKEKKNRLKGRKKVKQCEKQTSQDAINQKRQSRQRGYQGSYPKQEALDRIR